MKLQYLGDSRDSFKWDYQDFLASQLGYRTLNFVPMLTPDDTTNHGKTDPRRFPARSNVIDFCDSLRRDRRLESVQRLPSVTGSGYELVIHRPGEHLQDESRKAYFSDVGRSHDQLVFVDPDNGFEPKNRFTKHVSYDDVQSMLDQCTEDSAISVFQYWRRRKFDQDFYDIRSKLRSGYSAAIYGRYVMFVTISRSKKTIESTRVVNDAYAANKRVLTIS